MVYMAVNIWVRKGVRISRKKPLMSTMTRGFLLWLSFIVGICYNKDTESVFGEKPEIERKR